MEKNTYEKVTIERDQQVETNLEDYSYSTNECYELESYWKQANTSNAQNHELQSSGFESVGREEEHPGYTKGNSQIIQLRKYLIALSCAILLLTLVAIAALALGVVYYHRSSRELKDKDTVFGRQLNQMTKELETRLTNKDDIIREEFENMTIELERRLNNTNSVLRNQLYQLQNLTTELEGRMTNRKKFVNNQFDQLSNETQEVEIELTNNINTLKLLYHQSVSLTQDNISQVINDLNTFNDDLSSLQEQIYCGAGQWNRVAFLNMSDPSQQCPSTWRLVTTSGVRACGRQQSSGPSCSHKLFSTENEYNQVCGRVIGYQNISPDAFHRFEARNKGINNAYLDGVSITYGQRRKHIWSYAAGVTERSSSHTVNNWPCSIEAGIGLPSFVGDDYYCESGNPTDTWGPFRSADKLWDGKQCEGTCCSGSKSPPWFSVHLPNSTTESIEVRRICGDQSTDDEDTPLKLLEIYVQ